MLVYATEMSLLVDTTLDQIWLSCMHALNNTPGTLSLFGCVGLFENCILAISGNPFWYIVQHIEGFFLEGGGGGIRPPCWMFAPPLKFYYYIFIVMYSM